MRGSGAMFTGVVGWWVLIYSEVFLKVQGKQTDSAQSITNLKKKQSYGVHLGQGVSSSCDFLIT